MESTDADVTIDFLGKIENARERTLLLCRHQNSPLRFCFWCKWHYLKCQEEITQLPRKPDRALRRPAPLMRAPCSVPTAHRQHPVSAKNGHTDCRFRQKAAMSSGRSQLSLLPLQSWNLGFMSHKRKEHNYIVVLPCSTMDTPSTSSLPPNSPCFYCQSSHVILTGQLKRVFFFLFVFTQG